MIIIHQKNIHYVPISWTRTMTKQLMKNSVQQKHSNPCTILSNEANRNFVNLNLILPSKSSGTCKKEKNQNNALRVNTPNCRTVSINIHKHACHPYHFSYEKSTCFRTFQKNIFFAEKIKAICSPYSAIPLGLT